MTWAQPPGPLHPAILHHDTAKKTAANGMAGLYGARHCLATPSGAARRHSSTGHWPDADEARLASGMHSLRLEAACPGVMQSAACVRACVATGCRSKLCGVCAARRCLKLPERTRGMLVPAALDDEGKGGLDPKNSKSSSAGRYQ